MTRFVDFAIDLATILAASRSVASKHIALRGRQLDRYNRTSSVAAAFRRQKAANSRPEHQHDAGPDKSGPAVRVKESSTAETRTDATLDSLRDGVARKSPPPAGEAFPWRESNTSKQNPLSTASATPDVLGSQGQGSPSPDGAAPKGEHKIGDMANTTGVWIPGGVDVASIPTTEEALRNVRSQEQKEAPDAPESVEKPSEDDEAIPEGLDLNLFRTSRGSRLSPLWKEKKKAEARRGIYDNLGTNPFRHREGPEVIDQLKNKPEEAGASFKPTEELVVDKSREPQESFNETTPREPSKETPNPSHPAAQNGIQDQAKKDRAEDNATKPAESSGFQKPDVSEGRPSNPFSNEEGPAVIDQLKNKPEEAGASFKPTEEPVVGKAPEPQDAVHKTNPRKTVNDAQSFHGTVPAADTQTPAHEDRVKKHIKQPVEPSGVEDVYQLEKPVTKEDASALGELIGGAAQAPKHELRESKVPSSRLGRIWNYSGLAAGMFAGAMSEGFSRAVGRGGQGSMMLSPANMERLVAKLSKMRGAALKLGQLMSFQDSKMLPAPIQEVLQRVQDRADYMPSWQRNRVLATNLGSDWRDLYDTFDEKPIAAASIGQVHRATLKSNGAEVAVKIQFPGVADSINSDLDNLSILLSATNLLPKGLYLNKTIDNARTELGWECDYEREAKCAIRYRDLLAAEDDIFMVPRIYPEASGKQVLTMEFMEGIGVTRVTSFTQEQRDWIGAQILGLCLREITEFRFMQTDPNWTNFLYDANKNKLVLLDFGASREYPDKFITQYVQLLAAASRTDRKALRELSIDLGYLTGHESKTMLDAHITSILTLAEPFLESAPEVYDFRDQTITERVKEQIPVMIRERLAPPPEETYSLHRKLSGAFLLCARLGSKVRCREMFEKSVKDSQKNTM